MFVKGIQFPNVLSQKWLVRPFVENNVPPVNIYLREEINLIQEILMICLPDSTQITWVGNIWLKESGSRKKKWENPPDLFLNKFFPYARRKWKHPYFFLFPRFYTFPEVTYYMIKSNKGIMFINISQRYQKTSYTDSYSCHKYCK